MNDDFNPKNDKASKDDKLAKRARGIINRVKRQSEKNNIELSEWEGEFLDSLDERLEKYGRAFVDPDLGAMNAPLSLRQGLKLRQIRKKSNGDEKKPSFKNTKSAINNKNKKNEQGFEKSKKTGFKTKKPLQRKTTLKNKPNFG